MENAGIEPTATFNWISNRKQKIHFENFNWLLIYFIESNKIWFDLQITTSRYRSVECCILWKCQISLYHRHGSELRINMHITWKNAPSTTSIFVFNVNICVFKIILLQLYCLCCATRMYQIANIILFPIFIMVRAEMTWWSILQSLTTTTL